jgi:hypothetical protein
MCVGVSSWLSSVSLSVCCGHHRLDLLWLLRSLNGKSAYESVYLLAVCWQLVCDTSVGYVHWLALL